MEAVFSVLSAILGFATIIGTFWMFAIPVGVILVLLKAFKKVNYRWRTILLIGFGGLALFILSMILFFLLNVVAEFLGINVPRVTLPTQ